MLSLKTFIFYLKNLFSAMKEKKKNNDINQDDPRETSFYIK